MGDENSWEDKDEGTREEKKDALQQVEMDSPENSNLRKTTSASKSASSPPNELEKAKEGTSTKKLSKSEDFLDENRLHQSTETDYHVHIGSLLLTKSEMIITSIAGAVFSFVLTFMVGSCLVRFCRKSSKQANFV